MILTLHPLTAVHKQALGEAVPRVMAALPVGSSEDGEGRPGWVQAAGLTGLRTWTD